MTGDESYNKITIQALTHQAGPDKDYMPKNQTLTEGNDDQGFWVMSAMSAAERAFPDPAADEPQYLALAQAVFNEWVGRWDTEHCGGGMRWQIFPFNNGYDYKNTISNGCFFNIAARLARYTGNKTYADWAEKIYDWHVDVALITDKYEFYDGRHALDDGSCGKHDKNQWSYNAGVFLQGVTHLWNHTEDEKWKVATEGILNHTLTKFFRDGIVYEQHCETFKSCNQDQRTFKGYLLRWMASAIQMAPFTAETLRPLIRNAGEAALKACSGPAIETFKGHDGTACGFTWLPRDEGPFDNSVGPGEQMNALDAVMYNLVEKAKPPVTAKKGGTSKGDVNGGVSDDEKTKIMRDITTADRVGAGIVTAILIGGMLAFCAYLIFEEN